MVSGRGDTVNVHDILTGSDPQGLLFHGRRRHHLRKLDEERRGIGHCGPSRPYRSQGHEAHEFLELLARLARLQPGKPKGHWRRWSDLLFLGRLNAPSCKQLMRAHVRDFVCATRIRTCPGPA